MSLLDIDNNNNSPIPGSQTFNIESLSRLAKNADFDTEIMPIGIFCDDNFRKIFQNCKARIIDLSLLGSKIPISDFAQAFENCPNLEIIRFPDPTLFRYGDVLNFTNLCYDNTSLKKIMGIKFLATQIFETIIFDNMFRDCKNLMQIPGIRFRIRKQLSCRGMFYGCESLRKIKINFRPITLYYKNLSLDTTLMCYGASSLEYFDMESFSGHIFSGTGPVYKMFRKCGHLQIPDNMIISENLHRRDYNEFLGAFEECDSILIKKIKDIYNRNKI